MRSKVRVFSPRPGFIDFSGCGAVGSARRSGRRGRPFKSDHPDQSVIHALVWAFFGYLGRVIAIRLADSASLSIELSIFAASWFLGFSTLSPNLFSTAALSK